MKKFVINDIKMLSVPLVILLSIVVLTIFSIKIIFNNVSKLNEELDANNKTKTMLQQKLQSLQNINPVVSNQSQIALIALPSSNSLLTEISQIESQAASLNLSLSNIRSNATTGGSKVNSSELDFNADGNFSNIVLFVQGIQNSAPINRFDSIKIINSHSSSGPSYRLTASLFTYWAPLPKSIPTIDQPINELNQDEQNILSQISTLQVNSSTVNVPTSSSTGVGRSDPFISQ